MNKAIRVKKAFTLIELVLVIILTSSVYFFAFSSFTSKEKKQYKVNIENIKDFLFKNFSYENELSLKCIENDTNDCYVFVDNTLREDIIIQNLFNEIPEVYNYDKDLSSFVFSKVKIDNIEYETFFELNFNKDRKHKSIVVDMQDSNVYLINSISKIAKKFENTNDVIDQFRTNEIEVKDAL